MNKIAVTLYYSQMSLIYVNLSFYIGRRVGHTLTRNKLIKSRRFLL